MEARKRYSLILVVLFIVLFFAFGFYYRDQNKTAKNFLFKAEKCRQELNSYGIFSRKNRQYRLNEGVIAICQEAANKDLEKINKELYQKTLYNFGYANFIVGIQDLKDTKDSRSHFLSAESAYKDYLNLTGNESSLNVVWQLANLYFYYLNNPQKAKYAAEILVSLNSFNNIAIKEKAGIYNLLGRTYLFLGDYRKAEKNFKKALSLNAFMPDEIFNIHINLNLARTFVEDGRIKDGVEIIKETEKFNSNFFDFCSVAGIYYLAKDYENSVAVASKYLNNPWCSYILGISYADTNKKEEAKINLIKFINFTDTFASAYKEVTLDIDYDVPAKSIFFRKSEENAKKILQNLK